MIVYTRLDSPLGVLTITCEAGKLTGIQMPGQEALAFGADWVYTPREPVLEQTVCWLTDYFRGKRPNPGALPLNPAGTAFQKRVWEKLLEIPCGETISYGALARSLGCASPRAVGSAISRNPIAIVIPCHRVVGSDGRLTGYSGGLERKRWLLAWEEAL